MYSASISHRIYIVITYCIVLNCLLSKKIRMAYYKNMLAVFRLCDT
jgi:hypothetical protein